MFWLCQNNFKLYMYILEVPWHFKDLDANFQHFVLEVTCTSP